MLTIAMIVAAVFLWIGTMLVDLRPESRWAERLNDGAKQFLRASLVAIPTYFGVAWIQIISDLVHIPWQAPPSPVLGLGVATVVAILLGGGARLIDGHIEASFDDFERRSRERPEPQPWRTTETLGLIGIGLSIASLLIVLLSLDGLYPIVAGGLITGILWSFVVAVSSKFSWLRLGGAVGVVAGALVIIKVFLA